MPTFLDSSHTVLRWLRKLLFHPMLYLSVLLHGLVFAIPGNPNPEEPEEEEVVEEEEAMVSLFAPAEEAAPEPPADEESEPPPPEPEPEPEPAPQPEPTPVSDPTPEPQATAPAEPAPAPEDEPEGESEEESTPESEPEEEPPPEFNPLVPRQQFVSGLANVGDNQTARNNSVPRLPRFYEEGEAFFKDDSFRYGIDQSSIQWFNDAKPNEIFQAIQNAYEGSGTEFIPAGSYGEGPLYEIVTPDGQRFGFLNLAPGLGGASTILLIWELDPRVPSDQQPYASNAAS